MAATKSSPLLPVPGETPASAADPYLGAPLAQNPYAAQALTTNILPSFEDSLRNPPPAKAPAAPAADPYAGAPVVEAAAPDAYAGAPAAGEVRGYDLTKLKASKVEDLVKDKSEFNPVEFYAKNTDALLADPQALKLVEDAYEQREKERMTAGQFAKAVITSPLHPIETAKTLGKAVKGAGEFVGELGKGVGQVFKTTGQAAGALSAGDLKETAARAAEVVDAFDSAQQKWVTTLTSKLLPRPADIRERLAYDADLKRKELAAAAGNGELAHALGTDQESLKASGVTLDPAAIQKLSVIEDPMFLVPVGGAIGVVSKTGKFLLGKAVTPAAAEAFAKVTNAMLERAAGGTVELAGKGVGALGTGVEKAGEFSGALLKQLGSTGRGAYGALIFHNPVAAIGVAAPTLLKYTGKGIGAVAGGIQKAAPFVGKVGLEGVKGAAEGAALSVPLFIGSTPEEREGLLGMIGGAGALRAGGTALGLGAHVGATAAQEKLASKIYEPVNRGPIKDSPHYGTDAKLDEAHAQQAANLPPGQQSVLSWAREFFRNAGIEIYALDNQTFQNHVPNVAGAAAAEGFFTTKGERVNPDGTRQPVVQVLLNGETNGLGHELYHAFKSLDPASAQALESHISKTWTPEEQTWIADTYNAALNGGKPKSQWKVTYDKDQILEEAAAEVFGRVLTATDLSGVRPSVVKRASEFASRALDKMGYPLGGKALPAGPGVSALGVRPGHSELKVSRDFLADIAQRVRDGTLAPPKPIPAAAKAPAAPTARPTPVAPPTPSAPPPAPAAPQPATPPEAPAAPAATAPEAPNIRVTPKEQLDFAAERSKVTNADEALAAAQKTGDSQQVTHVQTINDSMAQGHGVEIVHKGVIREGGPTPEKPVARGTRRAEQEAAYVAEAMGAVPDDIREAHQKVLFGTRWQQTKKSGPQLTARSLDKVLANVKNAADMAAQTKTALPYEVDPATGKLTDAGWSEVVQDLKDYWGNQDRGFRGDGEKLVRPVKDIGVSLPPEDPRGPVASLSPERTDFLNLVQGLNIPESVTRQTPGKIPGNVKGQLLAEAQGKKPAKPAAIRPEDVARQTYKPIEGVGVRSIAEVNPLRNELRAKGAPVGSLIEVTENVNLKDIESVTPRPDVPGSGGSTDITRAGFSVSDTKAEVARRLEEKKKAGIPITEQARRKTQQEVEFDLRSGKKLGAGESAGFFSLKANPTVKAEIDAVLRGEKPGETFNMDGTVFSPGDRKLDVVPLASENFAADKITPEALQAFVEKYPEAAKNPDVKAGVFKLSDGRVSADLNVLVDQSRRAQSLELAKANNQEALFDLAKGEVVPAGGTGEAKALSPKEVLAAVNNLTKPAMESFSPARSFPDEVDPIERAAIRTKGGHVVQGSWHGEALDELVQQIGRGEFAEKLPPMREIYDLYDNGFLTDGFVTRSGKFLNREEAAAHAKDIGQLKESRMGESARGGVLESDEFRGTRSFSAGRKGESEAAARKRVEETDYSKYNVPAEQKPKGDKPTGWILPNGKFVGLDTDYHQSWLGANSERLNKEFGTSFSEEGTIDDRMTAVNKGFIRAREYNGRLTIEASQKAFKGKSKQAVEDLLVRHATDLDSVNIHLLNDKGLVVSSASQRLFDSENPQADALSALERLNPEAATPTKGPSAIQRARALGSEGESFSAAKPGEVEQDFNVVWKPRKEGKTVLKQKVAAASPEEAQTKAGLPEGAHVVSVEPVYAPGKSVNFENKSSFPTDEQITSALSEDKKPFVGAARKLEPGTPVGLRIDIPAYNRSGTYVITVHEKAKGGQVGKRIGYDSIATVDNPTFFSNEGGALKIKEGAAKFPIATVEGEFNPSRKIPKPGDPQWAEVGFNPTKHSYFYEKGTEEPVVSGSQAVSVGNSVFVKDPVFGNKGDYAFSMSPAETPEERIAAARTGAHVKQKKTPGTPEYDAYVENKIQNSKNFPEAYPLDFRKDKNGNYLAQWDGDPLPKARPYDLLKSHLAKEVGSEEKFRDALAENLKREYHEAKKNPEIAVGEHWYSTFRERMGGVLGDDAKLFAELLGATSPQQAVGPNFKDALGAYNQFKSGAYDEMLAKYQEGKKKFADGDLAEFTAETGKTGAKATKEAFLNWWQKKHNLVPTKATGKKFGMNSRAVLKVLDGSWLAGVQGPKTPNFTGNLSGTTFKATIDVWAMRLLSRLANEKNPNPWRIQPANESGVQDKEFFFGQEAFQKAADDLGIKADALQAILWFAEKDLWERKGWTAAAGKAKSDYNTLLERTTKTPEGKLHFEPQEVKPKSKTKKPQLESSDVKAKTQ